MPPPPPKRTRPLPAGLSLHHLWASAHALHALAPAVSRHLAARLVDAVPPGGMSAPAARNHCSGCGALLVLARVRVRPEKGRRARRADWACRNRVRRRCGACGVVSGEMGVPRAVRPGVEDGEGFREAMADAVAIAAKGKGKGKGKDKGKRKGATLKDGGIEKGKKRKKSGTKASQRSGQSGKAPAQPRTSDPGSLATSFLFDPL